MTSRSILPRVYAAQVIGSTIDGIALSTAVLYFSTQVGLPAEAIGVVLAAGAASALLLSVPLGMLADAVGLRRAAVGLSLVVAAALTVYALADSLWSYAIGAVLFLISQAGIGAVRQALVASTVEPEARVRSRAVLHTLLNAGMGLGTVIGSAVAVLDSRPPYVIAFVAGAVSALVCGVLFFGLPRPARAVSVAGERRPGLVALRDRRFVSITALAALVQLTMPVLSVILPLWIITRTPAPEWLAPVVLVVNTALVISLQTWWTSRIRTDRLAGRSTAVAAIALVAGCVLFGAAAAASTPVAIAALLVGAVALTAGEIAGGAGVWHLAFSAMPSTAPGQYQAVFGMSGAVARILGPLLALPLVLATGIVGWIVVSLVMAAAALSLTALGRR
jgi:MFS family permease